MRLPLQTVLTLTAIGTLPHSAMSDAPVTHSVTPVGKPPIVGRIVSWGFPGELIMEINGGLGERMNAADIDFVGPAETDRGSGRLGRIPATAPAAPADWIVQLADGSRIVADISGGDDEHLALRHDDLGDIVLPIEGIDRLWRSVNREPVPAGDEDIVELANGDRLRGVVAGAAAGILRLSEAGQERPLAWDKVRFVALAAAKRDASSGLSAIVELTDGSRWVGRKFAWKAGELRVPFAGRADFSIPLIQVQSIEVSGGRRAWLGDLPPENYEATPYLETRWAYQIDKSVLGGPLLLAGRAYRRGIGLHSACRITWRLSGAYDRFTALVGIDDSAGPYADADVTIRLDDRELVALTGLHFGDQPRPIDLSVTGGDRITIEVGFGKRGDMQDRVDIVQPALIRK